MSEGEIEDTKYLANFENNHNNFDDKTMALEDVKALKE